MQIGCLLTKQGGGWGLPAYDNDIQNWLDCTVPSAVKRAGSARQEHVANLPIYHG